MPVKKVAKWPAKLSKPMIVEPGDNYEDRLFDEIQRRIQLIAKSVGCDAPSSFDIQWFYLLQALCACWNIPAFSTHARTGGRNREWSDQKYFNLYRDVQSLQAQKSTLSNSAACSHIAKNPNKFGNRYKGSSGETLRRRLQVAKQSAESDPSFQLRFGLIRISGLLSGVDRLDEQERTIGRK
jgi:hypothetical protein